MNWKKYSIVSIFLFALAANIQATALQEFTKQIEETFTVEKGSELEIVNRYGAIHLDVWDNNKVNIDVTIKVKTSSQSKADKIFEMINISLSQSGNRTSGITELNNKQYNQGWWDKLFNSYDSGNYEITYKVKLPAHMMLDITNKYGHIYHNSTTHGNANITSKYGNIYASDIEGDLNIVLGYGDAKLANAHNVKFDVKYSNIKMADAQNVVFNTKYSEIEAGNVEKVRSVTKYDEYTIASAEHFENDGKYDDIRIGILGGLHIDSKYSDIKINEISNSVELVGKYNSLQVKEVNRSTEKINVEGKYTNVKIKMPAGFDIDLKGEYISPKIPVDLKNEVYIKDDEDVEIKGVYGNGHTVITARLVYGSFKMID